MLVLLKYFCTGAFITFVGVIVITVIMLILNNINTRILEYLGIFVIISAAVGFITFCIFEKPDEYRFQISYKNVIFYTNDFTISGGAITFIDNDGNYNTIEKGYKITNLQ